MKPPGDLRTLTATGASSSTRRTLTGATAGALALLGALLGTAGAYAALLAWHRSNLHPLTHVPVANLVIILVGLPLIATAGGLAARRARAGGHCPPTARIDRVTGALTAQSGPAPPPPAASAGRPLNGGVTACSGWRRPTRGLSQPTAHRLVPCWRAGGSGLGLSDATVCSPSPPG